MGAGTDFVLGGLLQGVGKGLTDQYEEKRKLALANLQHEWDTEAAATKAKTDAAAADRKTASDLLVVDETGDQNRKTERVKTIGDVETALARARAERENIVLKGDIDLRNSTRVQNLMHNNRMTEAQQQSALDTEHDLKVAGVKVAYKVISPSGEVGFYNEKGDLVAQTKPGTTTPQAGGDGEGPTTGDLQGANAAAGGGGGDVAPSGGGGGGGGNDSLRRQALARLPGLYSQAQANPEAFRSQYPGMFDANGNLLPMSALTEQINQRYGG
jgi:hypothetical protein